MSIVNRKEIFCNLTSSPLIPRDRHIKVVLKKDVMSLFFCANLIQFSAFTGITAHLFLLKTTCLRCCCLIRMQRLFCWRLLISVTPARFSSGDIFRRQALQSIMSFCCGYRAAGRLLMSAMCLVLTPLWSGLHDKHHYPEGHRMTGDHDGDAQGMCSHYTALHYLTAERNPFLFLFILTF